VMRNEYLFSYGTLQPRHAPRGVAGLISKLCPLGAGTVRGTLYDLGEYPGAVLGSAANRRVFGTVFRLPNDAAVLRKLDEYEGFDASDPDGSLFVRRRCPVMLQSGRILPCWIYEYNGKRVAAAVVADVRYRGQPGDMVSCGRRIARDRKTNGR